MTRSPVPLITAREARQRQVSLHLATHIRVRSGVYAGRRQYLALPPWQRYAVRVHAFLRTHPEAVLCLESAAVVLGIPCFDEPKDIHVHDAGRSVSSRIGDVVVHAGGSRRVVRTSGIRTTSLLDTAVDLMRVLPPARGLAVADSAISPAQHGFTTLDQLRDFAAGQRSRRGLARARWVLRHADPRAESPGESVSRAVIGWCGFERPELQVRLDHDGLHDRADFLFPSRGVVGDVETRDERVLDDPGRAAARRRHQQRREDRLRRHGHPFVGWDLADAWKVEPLACALRAAGVPIVRDREHTMLASLAVHARQRHRAPPG